MINDPSHFLRAKSITWFSFYLHSPKCKWNESFVFEFSRRPLDVADDSPTPLDFLVYICSGQYQKVLRDRSPASSRSFLVSSRLSRIAVVFERTTQGNRRSDYSESFVRRSSHTIFRIDVFWGPTKHERTTRMTPDDRTSCPFSFLRPKPTESGGLSDDEVVPGEIARVIAIETTRRSRRRIT